MAKYNFDVSGSQLIVALVPEESDVQPTSMSYLAPSFKIGVGKINAYEYGQPKQSFLFTEIGEIDGVEPTDLQDAFDKLTTATTNFNWGGTAPISNNIDKGTFTGEFDVSNGVNNFYNDYDSGAPLDLSLSALKSLGTVCKVRVKGGLINSIPSDWILRGEGISTSGLFLNDLLILYVNDDEIILVNSLTENTGQFYPNDFINQYAWHKFDIASTTEVDGFVTSSTDSLTTNLYNLTAVGNITRSIQNLKECIYLNTSKFEFENTLNVVFNSSFSISMKIKLDDGRPDATKYLCSLRDTPTPTSRFWIDYRTTGIITVAYTSNGVSVFGQTLNPVFADGAMTDFNHLVVTIQSGGFMKIYYNGVEQTLSGGFPGDMSTVNMALFSSTSKLNIGHDVSAAMFSEMYVKDFVIQNIVYSQNNVNSLNTMP